MTKAPWLWVSWLHFFTTPLWKVSLTTSPCRLWRRSKAWRDIWQDRTDNKAREKTETKPSKVQDTAKVRTSLDFWTYPPHIWTQVSIPRLLKSPNKDPKINAKILGLVLPCLYTPALSWRGRCPPQSPRCRRPGGKVHGAHWTGSKSTHCLPV